MIATILLLIVAAALLFAAAVRARNWARPASRPMTIALVALAFALALRIPYLSDEVIDSNVHRLTGLANTPDVLAHILSVIAGAGIATHALAACKRSTFWIRTTWIVAGVAAAVMIGLWLRSGSSTIAVNMVNLPGMKGYSVAFALAFAVPQALMIYAASRALIDGCTEVIVVNLLRAGAVFGLAFSLHRLAVAAWPTVADHAYSAVSWTLALGTLAFYAGAAIAKWTARRTAQPNPA